MFETDAANFNFSNSQDKGSVRWEDVAFTSEEDLPQPSDSTECNLVPGEELLQEGSRPLLRQEDARNSRSVFVQRNKPRESQNKVALAAGAWKVI